MKKSLSKKSGSAEMFLTFAQVLAAQGNVAEALENYDKALTLNPRNTDAMFEVSLLYARIGQRDRAADIYEQILRIRPDFPEVLNNLGIFYYENRNYGRAIELLSRAVELRPFYGSAHNNLGNCYKDQQEWQKAMDSYNRALSCEPKLYQALNNMGLTLMYGASAFNDAASCFRRVLEIDPNNLAAMTHLGLTFCLRAQFAEGIPWYEKALAIDPNYYDALNNMGNAVKAIGRLEESLSLYERALKIRPHDGELHNNVAMALLALGRYEEGWKAFEWRLKTQQLKDVERPYAQPRWNGEEAHGDKTLLIYAEQGLGDTMQFCRYVPLAKKRGWKIVLEVQAELVDLMSTSPLGAEKVIAPETAKPPFDSYCPMLSLPLAFGTTLETIPSDVPYIKADQTKSRIWRERMAKDPKGLKVGLVWTGNPRLFSMDLREVSIRRSLKPDSLEPLAEIKNIQFYSLQKGGFELTNDLNMIDAIADCADFSDTAALVDNLDLVITVDTSVAHLAGAMGKPVWLLNRFDNCWRWLHERDDSPWYPTMRIFRQAELGDWKPTIVKVKEALEKLAAVDR